MGVLQTGETSYTTESAKWVTDTGRMQDGSLLLTDRRILWLRAGEILGSRRAHVAAELPWTDVRGLSLLPVKSKRHVMVWPSTGERPWRLWMQVPHLARLDWALRQVRFAEVNPNEYEPVG